MRIKLFVSAAAIALALGLGPATAGEDLTIHAGLSSPEATESQPQAVSFQVMQGIAARAMTSDQLQEIVGGQPHDNVNPHLIGNGGAGCGHAHGGLHCPI